MNSSILKMMHDAKMIEYGKKIFYKLLNHVLPLHAAFRLNSYRIFFLFSMVFVNWQATEI